MKSAVIILPTYNEKDNIARILKILLNQQKYIPNYTLHVLVVDDNSPDGTGKIVKKYSSLNKNISLISHKKEGLGAAYKRGIQYASAKLKADVVFEMDADFSHNPRYVPSLLQKIDQGFDIVIGSRYVNGGSIPSDWSFLRKANSYFGNVFARHVAGIRKVKDCTGGFRAIKTDILKKINMDTVPAQGYAFQIVFLREIVAQDANILEIPIAFIDRTKGKSKIRLNDIGEFLMVVLRIRISMIINTITSSLTKNRLEWEAQNV